MTLKILMKKQLIIFTIREQNELTGWVFTIAYDLHENNCKIYTNTNFPQYVDWRGIVV